MKTIIKEDCFYIGATFKQIYNEKLQNHKI